MVKNKTMMCRLDRVLLYVSFGYLVVTVTTSTTTTRCCAFVPLSFTTRGAQPRQPTASTITGVTSTTTLSRRRARLQAATSPLRPLSGAIGSRRYGTTTTTTYLSRRSSEFDNPTRSSRHFFSPSASFSSTGRTTTRATTTSLHKSTSSSSSSSNNNSLIPSSSSSSSSLVTLLKRITSIPIFSAILLFGLDWIFKTVFNWSNLTFPSSLAGCGALLMWMLLLSPSSAATALAMLQPGATLLAKWLPVFFVPSLVTLPLSAGLGSVMEWIKVGTVVVGGFFFTLLTTAFSVIFVGRITALFDAKNKAKTDSTTTGSKETIDADAATKKANSKAASSTTSSAATSAKSPVLDAVVVWDDQTTDAPSEEENDNDSNDNNSDDDKEYAEEMDRSLMEKSAATDSNATTIAVDTMLVNASSSHPKAVVAASSSNSTTTATTMIPVTTKLSSSSTTTSITTAAQKGPFSNRLFYGLVALSGASGVAATAASFLRLPTFRPITTIFFLLTTLSSFVYGTRLPKQFTKYVHPLLTCTAVTWTTLISFGVLTGRGSFRSMLRRYRTGRLSAPGAGDLLLYCLGPAVVSLAVSMYERRKLMRDNLPQVGAAIATSTIGGVFGTAALVRWLEIGDPTIRLALLSRNITSPLAMAIASILGADVSLAVSMVVVTGLIGANFGASILDALGIRNAVARGMGIGAAAHGLGTAAIVNEPDAFPFAAIAMALTASAATVTVSIPLFRRMVLELALGWY
ncbi:hypothetical protein ACA910_011383 [Epithemia clementina (nom. ined.)]